MNFHIKRTCASQPDDTEVSPGVFLGAVSSESSASGPFCSTSLDSIAYFLSSVTGVITNGDTIYENIGLDELNGGDNYYKVKLTDYPTEYSVQISSEGKLSNVTTC